MGINPDMLPIFPHVYMYMRVLCVSYEINEWCICIDLIDVPLLVWCHTLTYITWQNLLISVYALDLAVCYGLLKDQEPLIQT